MSLKYEPSSEPLHISAKYLFDYNPLLKSQLAQIDSRAISATIWVTLLAGFGGCERFGVHGMHPKQQSEGHAPSDAAARIRIPTWVLHEP